MTDFFIVNVALPSIQHGLGAEEGAIEWVVAGYTISTAVLLVTGGRLGDQFGRRWVFSLGLAIFVATSAACALAPDPAVLVAARVVQGVGAALMASNILSILGVVYTGPARVRAISIYGMVMGLAATSGQIIGGIRYPHRRGRAGLADDLLDQRAHWPGCAAGRSAPGPRVPQRARVPAGPDRGDPDHRLPDRGGAAAG